MNSMDLNISSYSVGDLKELFDLQSNYTDIEVELKAQELKDRILSRTSVTQQIKNDTLQFITQAKNALIEAQNKPLKLATYEMKPPEAIKNEKQYFFQHAENLYPKTLMKPLTNLPSTNIVIDTRFRPNYYITQSTNFTVNLPYKLRSVTSVSLSNASMEDAMFYNVTEENGNDFFYIRAFGPDFNPSIDISQQPSQYEAYKVHIPSGGYSTDNIILIINNFLQSLTHTKYLQYILLAGNSPFSGGTGQQLIFAISTRYYTINALGPSGEVIHNTPNFTFELDFQANRDGEPDYFTPLASKLGWSLGFRNGRYINNTSYLSEASCTATGPRYFYVCMDDGQVNYQSSWMNAFSNSMLPSNLLGRISVPSTRSAVSNVQSFMRVSGSRSYFGGTGVDLEKLSFQIKDEFGRILPGYNCDMVIVLTVSFGSLGTMPK